jgi:hypothetical protein
VVVGSPAVSPCAAATAESPDEGIEGIAGVTETRPGREPVPGLPRTARDSPLARPWLSVERLPVDLDPPAVWVETLERNVVGIVVPLDKPYAVVFNPHEHGPNLIGVR